MDIDVREMTTFHISEDGKSVVLKLTDHAGNPTSLKFQIADLGNLVMTLPGLIEAALRRQYRDTALRFAYPMGSWSIEQASDAASLIVTLRTKDGFGVSFSMARRNAEELANSMQTSGASRSAVTAH